MSFAHRFAMEPDRQIALSENLKKFQPNVFFFKFLLEFHLAWNQLPGWRLPCLDLSQYLGGELFLNLHLNFPILTLSSIPAPDQLVFPAPLPLQKFLLTRSKRQRLLQSNLGQKIFDQKRFCFGQKVGGGSVTNNNDHGLRIWRRKSEAREAKQPHFLSGRPPRAFPL